MLESVGVRGVWRILFVVRSLIRAIWGHKPVPSAVCRSIWIMTLTVVLAACTRPAARPHELTIQFTGDVHGRLVPCGCFSGQFGGLTRIATLFALSNASDPLRVD